MIQWSEYREVKTPVLNRDTPELRKFWLFPANPGFTVKTLWYCTN